VLGLCSSLGLACAVPVANDLDEPTANRVVAALGRNGVAADKQRDPESEGRFSVDVGRGDASFALSVMAREELPRHTAPGLSESLGQSSFIPSRSVISARVHLAVPASDPLDPAAPVQVPTASVLIKHSGTAAPISAHDIGELVAGAVQGLAPEHVTVLLKAVAEPVERTGTELVRLGPLTTTRSSLPYLRWMIACVATLNVSMVALLFVLWLRARRKPGGELGKPEP
jgi:type III secretory pathway lipoprotein EscJ